MVTDETQYNTTTVSLIVYHVQMITPDHDLMSTRWHALSPWPYMAMALKQPRAFLQALQHEQQRRHIRFTNRPLW